MDLKVKSLGIYEVDLISKKSMKLKDYKEKVDKDKKICKETKLDKIEEFVG